MITAATEAGRIRAWLGQHAGDVPRHLVLALLTALERDPRAPAPGTALERLGLAEGWLTIAEIAASSGCSPEQVKARIYGGSR